MVVAREHDVPRGWTVPLTEAPVALVGTTVACARLNYSDSHVPDCWLRFAEARVPLVGPLYIVLGRTVLIFVNRTVFRGR